MSVNAQSAVEYIPSFKTDIIVNTDGTIVVNETIAYFFPTERHGIYRDIPLVKTNKEGKRFRMNLKVRLVTDEQNNEYRYATSESDGVLRIKIGDKDKYVSGLRTYVITYSVSGALTYFSDHDELYWNSTGNKWEVRIASAEATVHLPPSILQPDVSTVCYTGVIGSTESSCASVVENNTVDITSDRPLGSGEGLTIAVRFPGNVVAVLEPKEEQEFFGTLIGKIVFILFVIIAFLWYVVYPMWLVIAWFLYGRDPSTSSGQTPFGVVRAWYDPPKTKGGRSLTPSETGALIDETVNLRDIQALIVDLAHRGYLKIHEIDKKNVTLEKTKEADANMTAFEKLFFNELFATTDEVELRDTDIHSIVDKTKEDIYTTLVAEGFFPKNPHTIRTLYFGLAILAFFTLNIPLTFASLLFGIHMARKTLLGAQQAQVGRGLKNFLASQERQLTFQAKNQMFFEKLLPYAVAFGVEKIWAERFKDIELKQPDWFQSYTSVPFRSSLFVDRLDSSMNQFERAATPTTSSSGFSSGFSGGSSGGGGGGGGGGSW